MSVPTSTNSPRSGSISDDGSIFAFDGADALLRAWGGGLKPDPLLTVSEWADRYRTLSSRAAAEPGRYRTKRTPYMKDIMDALSPGHPAQRVVFMKAAQVGATEAGNCFLGFIIHQAPGPALAVQPTVELAKRNSRQRIDPLIEESPALAGCASVEEHEPSRLQEVIELAQHARVVGQMLDHAHDDNGIELFPGFVFQEVGQVNMYVLGAGGQLVGQIGLRFRGNRDPGEVSVCLQGKFGERAPARADLEHTLAGPELATFDGIAELSLQRRRQGLVVAQVDALAVGRMGFIEKAQEQTLVGIVVRLDRLPVGVDLSEQQWLEETPGGDPRVPVVERTTKRE